MLTACFQDEAVVGASRLLKPVYSENTALSAFLCQSDRVGYFPFNSGIRSSNMTAKWFKADFQW